MIFRFWTRVATLAAVLWAPLPGAQRHSRTPQPVDINTATFDELANVPGLGPFRAGILVRVRERNGPFKSIDEVRILPRLSEKQFQQLRPYIALLGADGILDSSSHEPRHGAGPPR